MSVSRQGPGRTGDDAATRFPPELLYRAARLYYLENATQAEVAAALATSRPTVSRLLAEARATGIVHIEVREADAVPVAELEARLVESLGLRRAYVTPSAKGVPLGTVLAPQVSLALEDAALRAGDALLVSSGSCIHAVSQQPLPTLPGVALAPTVGGVDEPEARHQTNEITRTMAVKMHGDPVLLYAPAMPSPALYDVLLQDPSMQRVMSLWRTAKAALVGIGARPRSGSSLAALAHRGSQEHASAVGDICARPFDAGGRPIPFPGSDRLVAIRLEDLERVPAAIGCAVGAEKVPAIRAAARAGYINTLVTDSTTASLLIAQGQDDEEVMPA
jgi:DNA-binding transcriptional regulator LsrR (DeoR family)